MTMTTEAWLPSIRELQQRHAVVLAGSAFDSLRAEPQFKNLVRTLRILG